MEPCFATTITNKNSSFYSRVGTTLLVVTWQREKIGIYLLNEKRSLIPRGLRIKGVDLEDEFLFQILEA